MNMVTPIVSRILSSHSGCDVSFSGAYYVIHSHIHTHMHTRAPISFRPTLIYVYMDLVFRDRLMGELSVIILMTMRVLYGG